MRSIAMLAALAFGCSPGEPPSGGRAPVQAEEYEAMVEQLGAAGERIAELEAALESLRAPLAQETSGDHEGARSSLLARLERVEEELQAAKARQFLAEDEAARWFQGLERCVETLNQRAPDVRITMPAPRPRGGPRVRPLLAPVVSLVGDYALVSAKLWNPGDADQEVRVEISLIEDGREVDSTVQSVLVPAGGDQPVSARLRSRGTGTLSGRVRVLE